jgi:hypothetical protein
MFQPTAEQGPGQLTASLPGRRGQRPRLRSRHRRIDRRRADRGPVEHHGKRSGGAVRRSGPPGPRRSTRRNSRRGGWSPPAPACDRSARSAGRRSFDASVEPTTCARRPRVPIAVPAAAHTPAARLATGQREARPRAEIRRQVGCLGQDLRRCLRCGSLGTHPDARSQEERASSLIPWGRPGISALKRDAPTQ